MNDPYLIQLLLTVLFLLGSWLLITKQGRAKLKALKEGFGWKKFLLLLALILVPIAIYAGYILWTLQSTDPDVVGRQPDRPAPLNTPVSIDDMTVTVTGFSHQLTHYQLGGTDTYTTLTVRLGVSCDKDPNERCDMTVGYMIVLPAGNGYLETSDWLKGGDADAFEAGLQGRESVELALSPTSKINSKRKLSGARLIFVGTGGRPNSPHQA